MVVGYILTESVAQAVKLENGIHFLAQPDSSCVVSESLLSQL